MSNNKMIIFRMRAHVGTSAYVFNAHWCNKVGAMNLIVAGCYYCYTYWKSNRQHPDFALWRFSTQQLLMLYLPTRKYSPLSCIDYNFFLTNNQESVFFCQSGRVHGKDIQENDIICFIFGYFL